MFISRIFVTFREAGALQPQPSPPTTGTANPAALHHDGTDHRLTGHQHTLVAASLYISYPIIYVCDVIAVYMIRSNHRPCMLRSFGVA